jgi:hypothetical protein
MMRSRIEPMKKITRSLRQHRELILNYQKAARKYAVIRSNYDLNQTEAPELVHIF